MKNRFVTLLLPLALSANSATAGGFEQTFKLQGIAFRVTSANQGSVNTLRILPSGRLKQRSPIEQEIMGTVTGAEVADLNADGWPEIYVYVTSAGSGSYGSVVGYAVNRGKSVTPIYFPELADAPEIARGYLGHDEFAIIENTLARRFPLFKEGDTNAAPSGGKRQVHYSLKPGEAGWVLQLQKTNVVPVY
jgi:hypothetical protein